MRRSDDPHRHAPEDDDRFVAEAPTRREAEALETIEIRPLDPGDRNRFRDRWLTEVRADLLVNPAAAVAHADALIQDILRVRGYPIDDLYRRSGGLSVDQAAILRYFHAAHQIAAAGNGEVVAHRYALTDDLRHAVQQYRHLFDELVESPDGETFAG